MSRCEHEIDAIRIKLYEQTKGMTPEERIKRTNDKARELASQYGFVIIPSANRANYPMDCANNLEVKMS